MPEHVPPAPVITPWNGALLDRIRNRPAELRPDAVFEDCPEGYCPWGPIQSRKAFGPGVEFVETASHGGFRLSRERFDAMPPELRRVSFTRNQFYEEDSAWSAVVLAWPELFTAPTVRAARITFRQIYGPIPPR